MRSLLKADFFALLKSKLTYVVLFICLGFPILMVLIDLGLAKVIVDVSQEFEGEMPLSISDMFSVKGITFSAFNLTSNIGLIVPIFVGIITMADIRNGTIRNKVIIGKNRTQIYLSHLIVSMAFCVGMIFISFLMFFGMSSIFFKYGAEVNGAAVLDFFKCLVIGLLTFAYVASLSTFLALSTKSMPLTIIVTLVTVLVLSIACTFLPLLPTDKYNYIFYMIPTYATTRLGSSELLPNDVFWFGLGSYLVFSAVNSLLGIFFFNKTDLK